MQESFNVLHAGGVSRRRADHEAIRAAPSQEVARIGRNRQICLRDGGSVPRLAGALRAENHWLDQGSGSVDPLVPHGPRRDLCSGIAPVATQTKPACQAKAPVARPRDFRANRYFRDLVGR